MDTALSNGSAAGAGTSPSGSEQTAGRATLTVTDNRTGKSYEIPIQDDTIRATDLRQIKVGADDFGLMTYDPAYMNTASCKSAITYIDGDRGILLYRGYPVEQLAESSTYLEVAYLLVHGELPTQAQLSAWQATILGNTYVPEDIRRLYDGFHHDAHPMGMLESAIGALSTFYPEARRIHDSGNRLAQVHRLIAQVPTLAAFAYRHLRGLPYVYPDEDLSFTGNFLHMLYAQGARRYTPDPVLERAFEVLFILHADHEQNCSTSAVRGVGSSQVDPYSAVAAGVAALFGPLHGGANEEVIRMLRQIGSKDNVPAFIKRVKEGHELLMGFGHRVYKNYDPRARIIKRTADEVFSVTGRNPLLDIALELERIALQEDYFITRKLYPNVDFYSGLVYDALKLPMEMYPVIFACARTSGWVAQWLEMIQDPDQKIARPRQIFTGAPRRDYVPVAQRS